MSWQQVAQDSSSGSNACDSTACCTTITGPDDLVWRDLPAGYSGSLRHMKMNSGWCTWDGTLVATYPPASWGSPTDPAGLPAKGAFASTRFKCEK